MKTYKFKGGQRVRFDMTIGENTSSLKPVGDDMKGFFTYNETIFLNIEQQRKITARVAKMFNINYRFTLALPYYEGYTKDYTIYIKKKERDLHTLISVIMHEISHVMSRRQGKYEVFHHLSDKKWTRKDFITYKRVAMLAELYVDNRAERLTKTYFPTIVYRRSYRTREERMAVQKGYNEWADKYLKMFDNQEVT